MQLSLVLCFGLLATPAHGEALFAAPQTLANGKVTQPQLAVDTHGRATITWQAMGPEKLIWIQAVRVSAAGLPGPIQTLAKFPKRSPTCPCPRVVVDAFGRATIAWQGIVEEERRIQVAQMDALGAVGPVYTLSPPNDEGWHQRLAVDEAGRVTVLWVLEVHRNLEAVRLGTNGAPEEVRVLAENVAGLSYSDLAAGPEGGVTAAWPSSEGLRTLQLDAAGLPGPTREIPSTNTADGVVDVVVDSQGRATLAWWRGLAAYEAKSVRLDPAGIPGAVHNLSLPGEEAFEPRLAVDSEDRVTAVWSDFGERVHSARIYADGSTGTVHTLSEPGRLAGLPQIASVGGRTVAVWSHPPRVFAPEEGCLPDAHFDFESDVVKAAFLGADAQPEQIKTVSAQGEQALNPQVGLDALGLPAVVWETYDGTHFCELPSVRIQLSQMSQATEPLPGSAPSPPAVGPAPTGAGVLRLSRRARAKDRSVRLHVRCFGADCRGRLTLSVRRSDIPRQLRTAIGWSRKGPREAVVATGRFQLAPEAGATLVLALSRLGRTLVKQGAGQLLRTSGAGSGVQERTVRVRLGIGTSRGSTSE